MISSRLYQLTALTILSFITHGIEEYFTGFYDVDRFFTPISNLISYTPQATFLIFQVMWWIVLLVFLVSMKKGWQKALPYLFGIIIIFEAHHVIEAVMVGTYYPGLATSILVLLVGYFYWAELLRSREKINEQR